MPDEYEEMVNAAIAAHKKKEDNCSCPLKCPNGCGLAFYDPGLEGHYCSGCEWYDGDK